MPEEKQPVVPSSVLTCGSYNSPVRGPGEGLKVGSFTKMGSDWPAPHVRNFLFEGGPGKTKSAGGGGVAVIQGSDVSMSLQV